MFKGRCVGRANGDGSPSFPVDRRCGEIEDVEVANGTCGGAKRGNSYGEQGLSV